MYQLLTFVELQKETIKYISYNQEQIYVRFQYIFITWIVQELSVDLIHT